MQVWRPTKAGPRRRPAGGIVAWLGALSLAVAAWTQDVTADTLSGTALIRERIALPPGTTFEAVIADIARADAPAIPLARTVIEAPGQPPIGFSIDYDPAALDPRAVYALRATIRRDDQLLFTTDEVIHVLQEGGPDTVDIILKMVPEDRSGDADPAIGAHGLRLPATFRGTLPCADCAGVRHHLDLWPGQYYHLRRDWPGRADGPMGRDEVGRWHADPVRGAIVLHGAAEMPLYWQVKGPDRLRQMDMAGNPIESDLDHSLTSDGTLDPTDLAGMFLLGMMTYEADAPVFEECLSGVRYPIAPEGAYPALERAHLDATAQPGAPLKVHVEGGLAPRAATDGSERTSVIVDRVIKTIPGETCARAVSDATLTDTYWRIDRLMGAALPRTPDRPEPHLVLLGDADRRFGATLGCNRRIGRYAREDDSLSFEAGASTRMACPPPLDAMERQLIDTLNATRSVRLDGQRAALRDADGRTIAEMTAVYLR